MSRITIEPNKPDSPKPTLTASPLSNNGLRHVARKSTSMSNQIHINRNRLSLQTQAYSNQPTQISTQNMIKNVQLKPNLNGEKMMSQLGPNGSNGSRLAQNSTLSNTANSPDSNQKQFRNKMVSCKPFYQSKATECYPMVKDASTQIDLDEIKPSHSMVPVPVPVNVPIPMCMYQAPMPVPLLVPVPVPVPVFIPTTKKTYDRVQRRIKKLRKKLPSDPYEFEILLYAEKLARQEGISGFEDSSDGESETEPSASNPNQDFQEQLQLLQESDSSFKWTIGVKVFNTWLGKKIENVKCVSKLPNDLLKLKNEEINLLLAEFLSEVRKPNGEVYAPESIYYIGLGIQHYLQEKGRVESIFFDSSLFDEFQEALNEIAMRYKIRIDGDGQVASRIEEEILWETKQLGAYSPFVLLNTILYFNTKYFFLDKVEAHKKLSFANVKKHAKRNIGPNGEDFGKTVFLRYYPDFHGIEQVIYEQGENYENPLRCPVELYNFYISKCPESVKNRNDIFYLMPEKTSLPSSPVWFSSQPISDTMLDRMLNRIKMVKEVNELLLAAAPSTAPLIVQ